MAKIPEQPTDILRIVYTPTDIARLTVNTITDRMAHKERGLLTGIQTLDKILMPFFPGELIGVMARPSNYKTGFMQFLARQFVAQIHAENQERAEPVQDVVVYVTWEVCIEELGFYDLSNIAQLDASQVWRGNVTPEDMAKIEAASMHRAAQPIWVIGHSLTRRREMLRLTLPSVRDALLSAEIHYQVRPRAIFLDYLQEIDPVEGEERRMQVLYNVDRAKQLGRDCGCPVFIGVQAGRQVDERAFKLPQIGDGQETARIEQAADKLISLWLPANHLPVGDKLPETGWPVTENLLVLGLRKQRLGKSGQVLPLYVDPARNQIAPMEMDEVALDDAARATSWNGREKSWRG